MDRHSTRALAQQRTGTPGDLNQTLAKRPSSGGFHNSHHSPSISKTRYEIPTQQTTTSSQLSSSSSHDLSSSSQEDNENVSPSYRGSPSLSSSSSRKGQSEIWRRLTKEYESKAAPPDDYTRENVNGLVYKLTDEIQTAFHVSRFYVSGSYGRRVSLNGEIEVDLIVFLKPIHGHPPYGEELFLKLRKTLDGLCASTKNGAFFVMDKTAQPYDSIFSFSGLNPPFSPNQCPFWPAHDLRSRNSIRPDHVKIRGKMTHVYFRVFLAPALGKSSETQRQITYREMQGRFMEGRMQELDGWHPALLERPSEVIAEQSTYVHEFIRICRAWLRIVGVSSLDPYAVEMLAFAAAQRTLYEENKSQYLRCIMFSGPPRLLGFREYMMHILRPRAVDNNSSNYSIDQSVHYLPVNAAAVKECSRVASLPLDCLSAFTRFLETLRDLKTTSPFWDISMPATFVSPWECFSVSGSPDSSPSREYRTAEKIKTAVVTDFFNPYRNLLCTLTKSDLDKLVQKAELKVNEIENQVVAERQRKQQKSASSRPAQDKDDFSSNTTGEDPSWSSEKRGSRSGARRLVRLFALCLSWLLVLFGVSLGCLFAVPNTRPTVRDLSYSAWMSPPVQSTASSLQRATFGVTTWCETFINGIIRAFDDDNNVNNGGDQGHHVNRHYNNNNNAGDGDNVRDAARHDNNDRRRPAARRPSAPAAPQ